MTDGWPASPTDEAYRQVRTSDVATLLIGGALDTSTPPQNATRELLQYLPNGHQVVLPGFGHTATFFAEQPESAAGSSTRSSPADGSTTRSTGHRRWISRPRRRLRAGPRPSRGSWSDLRFSWCCRCCGRLATRTAAAASDPRPARAFESLHPIVLGPGGWFLGALVVLTTMPSVPLDDPRLAVLAIGVPVGLGIYWAWVDRDWTARTKTVGFAAAAGGAFVGSWLGFECDRGVPGACHRDGRSRRRREPDGARRRHHEGEGREQSPRTRRNAPVPAGAIHETPLPRPRPSGPGLRPDADEAVRGAVKSSGQLPREGASAHDRSGRGHSGQA